MHGYIYLTTNKINGKQYVGQKVSEKFVKSYKGSGRLIVKAIKKYGFDNFECHIIDTAESQEELNDKEYVYIELYQTKETGYNLQDGGGGAFGWEQNGDSNKKRSEAMKGKKQTETHIRNNAIARHKKIGRFSIDGKLIETFECIKDAINNGYYHLSEALKTGKLTKGFYWKYIDTL